MSGWARQGPWVWGVLGLMLCGTVSAGERTWARLSSEERTQVLAEAHQRPFSVRLVELSARFLGTPYVVSPLGEGDGKGPDGDPLLRYDAVDCLTFVEETLALALSQDDAEVVEQLTRIRYGSEAAYAQRNHLMEAQWLPHNRARGLLRDVTQRIAGQDVLFTQKRLTARTWVSASSLALGLPPEARPVGEFPLVMLPLAKVQEHAARIPSGTLLVVVRSELPSKATRITHLGLVIQRGPHTLLRHAARSRYGRVVDEPLEDFLSRNARYEKWKVEGVSLFELGPAPSRSPRVP